MIEFDILELIPEASHELVKPLIFEKHLNIKIVKVRKTKHGDFKKLRNGNASETHWGNEFEMQ